MKTTYVVGFYLRGDIWEHLSINSLSVWGEGLNKNTMLGCMSKTVGENGKGPNFRG